MAYTEKMRMRQLPPSYTATSDMPLVPPRRVDASDHTLRDRAQNGSILGLSFDNQGFQEDSLGGLTKDTFYVSPYLTCEECNGIVYIDATALRSRLGLSHLENTEQGEGIKLPMEPLPPCPGCARTNTFRIGADDLTRLLAGNAEELARRKRVMKRMAVRLQRCYRFYLRRRYGRAQRHAILIRRMLEARCAAAIQAMARGRLGRRRFQVEKSLVVIKQSHLILLNRALHSRDYHKKVYWYKTKTELDILYADYYQLVERTGFNPPICIVEDNINEIAQRILDREAELCTRVQARWRGIVVRRYLNVYRLEVARTREIMGGCAYILQRIYRGRLGRRRAHKFRVNKLNDNLLDQYQTERYNKAEKLESDRQNFKMKAYYKKERQEERSARFTGLSNPKLHEGKKMLAFRESSYGYDSVQVLMDDFMEDVTARKQRDDELALEKSQRAEWVRVEQSKDVGLEKYFDEEMRQRREGIIKKLTKSQSLRNVGAMLMEHNSKGIAFKYPDNCYSDPMAILKEEIVVRENVRRDKDGKRIRTKEELEELKEFDLRGKAEALAAAKTKRRGGVTIGTIAANQSEANKEQLQKLAEERQAERRGGQQQRSAPSFIKKAEAAADGSALAMEKAHRVSNIVTKGRRDAAPALKTGNIDSLADIIDNY
jgi:hypothetical protein